MTNKDIKTITLTSIVDAGSLNYDEGLSVISPLKKINTSDGVHAYMSPQAFKYSLYTACKDLYDWNLSFIKANGAGENKVSQKVSTIIESEEVDLFGTMVTDGKGYKREAVVRVSPTISTKVYQGDKELLINLGLTQRINSDISMATIEHDRNLYKYSITIDYDRIGKDEYRIYLPLTEAKELNNLGDIIDQKLIIEDLYNVLMKNNNIIITNEQFINKASNVENISRRIETYKKSKDMVSYIYKIELKQDEINKRTNNLLDGLYYLYRDIRGRRENLSPVFCIGTKGNKRFTIFENIVKVLYDDNKPSINIDFIQDFCKKENLSEKDYKFGGIETKFNNSFNDMPKDVIEFLKV